MLQRDRQSEEDGSREEGYLLTELIQTLSGDTRVSDIKHWNLRVSGVGDEGGGKGVLIDHRCCFQGSQVDVD